MPVIGNTAVNIVSSCMEGECSTSTTTVCDGCVSTPQLTAFFAGLDIAAMSLGRTYGMVIASETFGTTFGTTPIPGRLYAFGDNSLGQLGTGDFAPIAVPRFLRTCCQRAVDFEGREFCLKWMDQVRRY